MPKQLRKPRRRSGIAAALKYFKPKVVKPRKGNRAYKRKAKYRPEPE